MKITLWPAVLSLAAASFVTFAAPAEARTVGSGRMATETRAVSGFDAISGNASIDVVVRQADKEGVTVEAEDNILPLVETVVEPSGSSGSSGQLVIRFKRGESISTRKDVKVTVDVVRLQSVSMAGSGDLVVQALKTPALRVSLAGSSDVNIAGLAADALDLSVSGSSDIVAAGRAAKVKLSIAGSGDAKMRDLVADDVVISIAGSGDAEVHADKSLEVTAAGSGDVVWRGAATQVKQRIAGAGSVTKK